MKTFTKILKFAAVLIFILPTTRSIGQELQVSPAKIFFTANPGSSQTKQVHVRNKSKTAENFIFNLNDWLTDENGEGVESRSKRAEPSAAADGSRDPDCSELQGAQRGRLC